MKNSMVPFVQNLETGKTRDPPPEGPTGASDRVSATLGASGGGVTVSVPSVYQMGLWEEVEKSPWNTCCASLTALFMLV
jgi:hypothetical protein